MNHRWAAAGAVLCALGTTSAVGDDARETCTGAACVESCKAGVDDACDRLRRYAHETCEAGDARACGALAEIYHLGALGSVVSKEAENRGWRRACELGDGSACNQWAYGLAYGVGTAKDDAHAVVVWERGCELGDGLSCATAGGRYQNGRGVPEDLENAAALLERACSIDSAVGCTQLGFLHRARGKKEKLARESFRRGCTLGAINACEELIAAGEKPPVEPDYAKAAERYRAACEDDEGLGCYQLGLAEVEGKGVAQDHDRGWTTIGKACRLHFTPACAKLGAVFLAEGKSELAAAYLLQACIEGDSALCAKAGELSTDPTHVAAAYTSGCQLAEATSCHRLGELHERGAGVDLNGRSALDAYKQACDGGVVDGCLAAERLTAAPADQKRYRSKACALGHKASCRRGRK
jgi:uncharacterized protein